MLLLASVTWAYEHLLSRALAHVSRQKDPGLMRPSLASLDLGFPICVVGAWREVFIDVFHIDQRM